MIPQGISFKSVAVFVCFFTIILIFIGPAAGQESPSLQEQTLYFTSWEGNFLSWHRQGVAIWVTDSQGNLRFEIMLDAEDSYPGNLHRILDWNGAQGWTVISVVTGGGTFSRWNEEWQQLPAALDSWLRVVVAEASGGLNLPDHVRDITPGGRSVFLPFFENAPHRPTVKRLQLPGLNAEENNFQPPQTLRRQCSARGRGRGGREAVLNISESPSGDGSLRITSSHQPGSIHLGPVRSMAAKFQPEEVFLPWWPLSEILHLKI